MSTILKTRSFTLSSTLAFILVGCLATDLISQDRGRDWRGGDRGADRGGDRRGDDRGRDGRGGDARDERGRGDWGRGGDNRDMDRRRDDQGGEARREERRWDPTDFIRRLDTNGNGRIDPSEMTGRSGRYLQSLGFDTENPIPIDRIIDRVREEQGGESSSSSTARSTPAPKVPGFGAINEPVPNFGGMSDQQLEKMFSPDVLRRVEQTMERYDRNGDGVLDEEELSRGNWGSPPYQQSDLNGDGRLSRLELAYRYRARDSVRIESNEREPSRREGRDPFDRSDRGTFSAEPMTGSARSDNNRRSSFRDRMAARDSSSNSPSQSDSNDDANRREQTVRYVESMLERYDSDKDGKLSSDEVKEMRNPPPLSGDGSITKDQYVDFLISGKKPDEAADGGSSTADAGGTANANQARPATASRWGRNANDRNANDRNTNDRNTNDRNTNDRNTNDRNDRRDNGRTSDRTPPRTRTSFADFDTNENGMIEMHEFNEEWNEEKLKEYYQIDTNRDGVITRREWEAAGRR